MRPSIRRSAAPMATVLLACAALAACSEDSDHAADFEESPPPEASPSPEPEDDDSGEDDQSDDSGEDDSGEVDEADEDDEPDQDEADGPDEPSGALNPDDAIETISYELPGDSSTTVEVGLHGLREEGEVMLLELSFTGQFYGNEPMNIYAMMGGSVYPELNDREHLKQYTVIGTGHDRWSTPSTNAGHRYESGQTAPYWAYYAAPVDDIDTITVTVIPGAVEFEDVEIER